MGLFVLPGIDTSKFPHMAEAITKRCDSKGDIKGRGPRSLPHKVSELGPVGTPLSKVPSHFLSAQVLEDAFVDSLQATRAQLLLIPASGYPILAISSVIR